jgi:hypothetical protein
MGTSSINSDKLHHRKCFSKDPPFNIRVPDSLRDPTGRTFSINQLQRLGTLEDAQKIALDYLHDDKIFAELWNSNQIYPETRRWLRKLVQIQTINAVCSGYERKIRSIHFYSKFIE